MKQITKSEVYRILSELKKQGNDVTRYLSLMYGCENIPYEVIVFINNKQPLDKLVTYNQIYNKRRNSPLFRNIIKTDNTVEEKAIILSSLLTQSLIGAKHTSENTDKLEVIDALNVNTLLSALSDYANNGNDDSITDAFDTYQLIFKTLFPRNKK